MRESGQPFRTVPKSATLVLMLLLPFLVLQPLPASAMQESSGTAGDFLCDHVVVNRINLALKEISLLIDVYAVVNSSFLMIVWIPRVGGYSFSAEGIQIQDSPVRHGYHLKELPIDRVAVKTVGDSLPAFLGLNPFPFEGYETEFLFAFNVTGIHLSTGFVPRPILSQDLEQEGIWNLTVQTREAEGPASKWQDSERVAGEKNLRSFFTLSIVLSHPLPYRLKMTIPAWGTFVFLILLSLVQFWVVRARLSTGDNVALFIGAAVLVLGQSLSMREVTPPELTLPEFLSFSFTIGYLILLALVIRSKRTLETAEKRIGDISEKMAEIGRLLQYMSMQMDSGAAIKRLGAARESGERFRRPDKMRKTRQGKGKSRFRGAH